VRLPDPLAQPFATANRSPFLQATGLPDARGAVLLAPAASEWAARFEVANSSIDDAGPRGSRVFIDGETRRFTVSWRRGFGGGWEAGLELPFLRHSGGFLDAPIERWHDLFGMPNGNRDRRPRDALLFSYGGAGGRFLLNEAAGGPGDLRLTVGRALGEGSSARATLSLPTGDADNLTGSGTAELATSLHFRGTGPGQRFYHQASAGVLLAGDGEVLPQAREAVIGFGSVTLGWRATDRLHLKLQADAHTAAYDVPGEVLGEPSLQLVIGGSLRLADSFVVDLAVSEDIVVTRSPDVVLQLGLRWYP
jgi:hypothetical protein